MKPRWYVYKGRKVRATNKEQANRLLGNPLGYKDLTAIKKAELTKRASLNIIDAWPTPLKSPASTQDAPSW